MHSSSNMGIFLESLNSWVCCRLPAGDEFNDAAWAASLLRLCHLSCSWLKWLFKKSQFWNFTAVFIVASLKEANSDPFGLWFRKMLLYLGNNLGYSRVCSTMGKWSLLSAISTTVVPVTDGDTGPTRGQCSRDFKSALNIWTSPFSAQDHIKLGLPFVIKPASRELEWKWHFFFFWTVKLKSEENPYHFFS